MRLDFDCTIEKTKPAELARWEELKMHVVRLSYRDEPRLIEGLLDLARPLSDKIEGESEEVLTVHLAPDGTVLRLTPPPRCKLDGGVEGIYRARESGDKLVDRTKALK